jgi:hypothetical protein
VVQGIGGGFESTTSMPLTVEAGNSATIVWR